MIKDKSLIERLNFLNCFKIRSLRDSKEGDGSAEVLTLKQIPVSDDFYWVSGTTILNNGIEVESVFYINSDGGTLISVFWRVDECWFKSDDKSVTGVLDLNNSEIFPFDWRYNTPLSKDIYHD